MNKQDFAKAISEYILDPIGKKIVRPADSSPPDDTKGVPTPPPPLIENNGTNAQAPIVSIDQQESAAIIKRDKIEEAKLNEVLQNKKNLMLLI